MSFWLAARMLSALASIASAIASNNAFFSGVESSASFAAPARARNNFFCVVAGVAIAVAISVHSCRRKVGSGFALHAERDPVGQASVDDGHVNARVAGQPGR